ncbi:unnamed protein product [Amaranthus hypochondriacus]
MGDLMWVKVLLIVGVLIIHNSEAQSFPTNLENSSISKHHLTIFELGDYKVTKSPINVRKRRYSAPEPLIIVSPIQEGLYPVLLFLHGTLTSNQDYSDLFYHIASHGYIVVAPQLFSKFNFPSQQSEIDMAATVANWIPSNLNKVLQDRISPTVKPNLNKVAVSGHSRGGKSAFALTLNYTKTTKLTTKISALIGLDPVAGKSKNQRFEPYILNYEPNSLDISIPVTIIGTGLGNITRLFIPCAPNEVSHQQFYDESKKASHFVVLEYGHMEMLNDRFFDLSWIMCKTGDGPRSVMRRTVGGIMVAFLDAYFRGDGEEYFYVLDHPSLAPTTLFVENKGYSRFVS